MKQLAPLCLSLLFFIVGCSDRDDNITAVNIRIQNVSDVSFSSVRVGAADMIHENVAPTDFSEYLEYEEAFEYAFIEIMAEGETYVLQPIDFVGETSLAPGFYTYKLDISESGNVVLEFQVD